MSHIRIFKHYIPSPLLILGILEFGLLFFSLLAGDTVRYARYNNLIFDAPLLTSAAVYAGVMLACTYAMGVYNAGLRDGNGAMAVRTVVAYCLLGCVSLTVIYYVLPALFMGRGVLFISVVISLALVIPVRWFFLKLVDADSLRSRILVLGVGNHALQLAEELEKSHNGVARIVGFIQTNAAEQVRLKDSSTVLQHSGRLLDLVLGQRASEVVVALDDRRAGNGSIFPLDELFECKVHGIRISESIAVIERELGLIAIDSVRPGWLVFSSGFTGNTCWNVVKRAADIVIALILLLLVWPIMLISALAIYLETGAPIIYRQVRVGLEGRQFEIFKFRSMSRDAEKDGVAVWARSQDSRVTRVGAFIRNTRIDELPQLVNVLRGDMSIVGPRPERPEFVSNLLVELPYYEERHHVKPGLMGWAQLNYPYGASTEDAAQKLRYDLYYVKNRSLLLDLIIMVQTVQVILLGAGVR